MLNGSSGQIVSPNYPNNYSVLTSCEWVITVPDKDIIEFTFWDLKTESPYDAIEVFAYVDYWI